MIAFRSKNVIYFIAKTPLLSPTLEINAPTVTFEPTAENFLLTLLIKDDNILEYDEVFVLRVWSNVSEVNVGTGDMDLYGNATFVIVDDDCKYVKS